MNDAAAEITCEDLSSRQASDNPLQLIDCREQNEWDFVRMEGATFLPMSEIATRVGELESLRDTEFVVYCHHGGRSLQVTMWLRQQGYSALSLAGGIDRWAEVVDPKLPRY